MIKPQIKTQSWNLVIPQQTHTIKHKQFDAGTVFFLDHFYAISDMELIILNCTDYIAEIELWPDIISWRGSDTYSRLSLSRIPRDSLKYFEISVVRHIRFAELRKK